GMAFLVFAGAAYFGFDAAAAGSAGQMVLGGFVGMLGSWGSLFYGRHLALGLAAVAVRPGSGERATLNLDALAARHGLASLEATRDLPAGVFAEIEPATGRGFIASWLVTPWSRADAVRASVVALVLTHEAQRRRLSRLELLQTPVLYLTKPFFRAGTFSAVRDRWKEGFRAAWSGMGEWAQMGSGLFSYATNAGVKAFPAAPALMVAGPVAGLGGSTFLTDLLGLVAGPTVWSLPDSLHSLLRGGGFLGAPGVAESRKGDALVVSLPEGKLSPAVGRALLQFLSGIGARLESDNGRAPVHVELVIGAAAPSADQRGQLMAAFRQLAQSGGVSKDLQDRLTIDVTHRAPEVLKTRLGELAQTSNINVLSSGDEAPFWFGLGVPLRVFAVRLLEKLTQVEVEVVFTGAEAEAVARLSGQRVENGQLRLKALGRPLDILDADTRKIETFNQQA
ncbi:MAG TPA: hypothetical protein PK362_03355, partial [Elusimicrobiota bacterium]|nr:hypothetical protein [Elusimicrobiota bacterium]